MSSVGLRLPDRCGRMAGDVDFCNACLQRMLSIARYWTLSPIRLAMRLRWICEVPAAMVAARASR